MVTRVSQNEISVCFCCSFDKERGATGGRPYLRIVLGKRAMKSIVSPMKKNGASGASDKNSCKFFGGGVRGGRFLQKVSSPHIFASLPMPAVGRGRRRGDKSRGGAPRMSEALPRRKVGCGIMIPPRMRREYSGPGKHTTATNSRGDNK